MYSTTMNTCFFVHRRDFRLVIGDPNHPGKAIPNPVVWLKNDVVMEVNDMLSNTRLIYCYIPPRCKLRQPSSTR